MGRKTFFLAKQQKHLQSTPLAEPIRTVYVLAMCAHFFAMFCWSQKNRILVLAESCSRCTKICLCRARRTLANDARVPNRQSRVLTASRRAHPQSRHRAHSSHYNYYTYFSNY